LAKLAKATNNTDNKSHFYNKNSSAPAQQVLKKEIKRITKLKVINTRLIHFLALIAVFQQPLFWIMDTAASGGGMKQLLTPLIQLHASLMQLSNTELRIDEMGRRYVKALVGRFASSIEKEPSPLYLDGITLNWDL
jgi:hypothetical protein